jgi:hypothetical protein
MRHHFWMQFDILKPIMQIRPPELGWVRLYQFGSLSVSKLALRFQLIAHQIAIISPIATSDVPSNPIPK